MGKSARKKAKSKIDYNDFFDSTRPASQGDGAWHSGVTAMLLEEGADAAAARQPSTSGAETSAAAAMDTQDYVRLSRGKHRSVRLQQPSLKISKRGSRTTTQKKRKAAKQEKALAHAEKQTMRTSQQVRKKQSVAALKSLY